MKKVCVFLLIVVLGLPVLFGADADADVALLYKELGKLMDEMIVILKAHKGEPEVAATKLNAFTVKNRLRLKALNKRSEQLNKDFQNDPNKAAAFMSHLMPLIQKGLELAQLTQDMLQHPSFKQAWDDYQKSTK